MMKILCKLYQNRRKYVTLLQRLLQEACVSAHASSAGFFIFLSVIPMGMIIFELIPYSQFIRQETSNVSQAIIPERIYEFLLSVMQGSQRRSVTLLSVTALVAVWSSSKGVLALMRGLNFVYQVQESRGFLKLRIRAIGYTLFLLLAIALSAGLLVFGNAAADALIPNYVFLGGIWRWLKPLRHVLVACLLALTFCSLYCVLPNTRMPWFKQLPGAVFTAVLWTLYSFLFSVYIDYGGGFSMYGSLATVVIVMIWLYFCMYIFFFGALVNRFLERFIMINERDGV
ncbi:MAG: YihY/virulence factor BrkB family protein [Lachnospiraceae bacterium]|nr:YihY/virulence factor BrkB family protein [Lachnospiraceae bacterium]